MRTNNGDSTNMPRLPRDQADRVLRRAIELSARHGEMVEPTSLLNIAKELDVDPLYVLMALAEVRRDLPMETQPVGVQRTETTPTTYSSRGEGDWGITGVLAKTAVHSAICFVAASVIFGSMLKHAPPGGRLDSMRQPIFYGLYGFGGVALILAFLTVISLFFPHRREV